MRTLKRMLYEEIGQMDELLGQIAATLGIVAIAAFLVIMYAENTYRDRLARLCWCTVAACLGGTGIIGLIAIWM